MISTVFPFALGAGSGYIAQELGRTAIELADRTNTSVPKRTEG
ncbi:hypothetical protein ACOALZ_16010 [Nocardiopsis algeriensis]